MAQAPIVAHALTDGNADDAPTGLKLIDVVDGDISCVTADGAYDTVAIYERRRYVAPKSSFHQQSRRPCRGGDHGRAFATVRSGG